MEIYVIAWSLNACTLPKGSYLNDDILPNLINGRVPRKRLADFFIPVLQPRDELNNEMNLHFFLLVVCVRNLTFVDAIAVITVRFEWYGKNEERKQCGVAGVVFRHLSA